MNKSYFFEFLLSALITCPLITFAASEPWTIEDVLEASSELSQQMRDPEVATQKPLPQAFVLVSFSMPEASLERLARDTKDAGVPLVFRGVPETKGPSDSKLPLLNPQSLSAFQPLIESGADVQLNPELFSEFNIRHCSGGRDVGIRLRSPDRSQRLRRRGCPHSSRQTWEPSVMLNNSPRAAIATALLMLFSSHTGAYDKQSAMDAAKEEAAKLSIKDILTESSASGTVPEYGSDVSELKDLFAKGQGNLLTPGTSKADGCLSQTSMDCRAVQVIYDTHSRPGWEESDFDNILADRDHLLNKVPDLPSNGEEICETITTTRPPQTDFAVCEETTVGSSTQSCFEGWTEKLDVSTLFECIARTGKKLTVECLADYNETSQDYTCLHTPPQTCHVGEKVEIQSTYQYRCKTQQFEQNTYRCNRYLEVVGYSGCEIGKFFEAQSETSSSLGKDACNGGDVIELKYQCSNDLIPKLRIETNVKNSANFGFEIQAADFQNEHYFSNCKGVWTGQTRCIGVNCTVDIKMDIYTRPGKWDYSGSIQKRFSFQKNVNDISLDKWRTTCVSDDGKVVEFES